VRVKLGVVLLQGVSGVKYWCGVHWV
jgi:hypothetical protein